MEVLANKVKIGRLVSTAGGFFLASSLFVLVSAWAFTICVVLVAVAPFLGGYLDRTSVLPMVSKRFYPIIMYSTLILAATAPWAIRYAQLYYHAAQLPTHPSMVQLGKSWRPISGDSPAGFRLSFSTHQGAEVIYDYYIEQLTKQRWKLRTEWPRETAPDHFLVQFYSAKGFLYLSYGSPYRDSQTPADSHHVSISYQIR